MTREIVLDTETTGLDPASGHRIVEIGCVEVIGKLRTGKHFHSYLNPERDVPEEVRRIHGLDNAFLADKPIFSSIVEELLNFIGDAPLVIHNAGFDMKFLNAELARLGFSPLPMQRTVDTVTMARQKFPGALVNLDALCKRFMIDATARTFHGALLDAELLADVYLELCGGRQATILFEETIVVTVNDNMPTAIDIPHRVFALAEEEAHAHTSFLATVKNALWNKYITTN